MRSLNIPEENILVLIEVQKPADQYLVTGKCPACDKKLHLHIQPYTAQGYRVIAEGIQCPKCSQIVYTCEVRVRQFYQKKQT